MLYITKLDITFILCICLEVVLLGVGNHVGSLFDGIKFFYLGYIGIKLKC